MPKTTTNTIVQRKGQKGPYEENMHHIGIEMTQFQLNHHFANKDAAEHFFKIKKGLEY